MNIENHQNKAIMNLKRIIEIKTFIYKINIYKFKLLLLTL